jgi:hypothetical protein
MEGQIGCEYRWKDKLDVSIDGRTTMKENKKIKN